MTESESAVLAGVGDGVDKQILGGVEVAVGENLLTPQP